ncbi:MAG: cyclase family protein, partial [Candidatus Bathyarchaeia archaeon]
MKGKNISSKEFDELFEKVCNWGKWGPNDERGTLNYISPNHVKVAAGLVRSGRSVSLAIPINTVAGPDNPHPAT